MEKDKHKVDEAFYHFVWQHRLYKTNHLETVDGLPVEVVHPGFLNADAGPDFFNAKVKIDGVLWAGNVEIHLNSADWKKHHHQDDKAYDNVILHVVAQYSTPVLRSDGSEIPTLEIEAISSVYSRYKKLQKEKSTIACSKHLKDIDPLFWVNFSDRLVTERLERKSASILKSLEQSHKDWEAVFFQTLCRSFGFGVNNEVFERLGKSFSYKIIAKHRNNLIQLEALLFGQAGFLEEDIEDDYYYQLQSEYRFLKAKYNINNIEKHHWRFLRLRPGNFPTIRISQLAYLMHTHDSLLHQILNSELDDITALFQTRTTTYWMTHFQFGKLSKQSQKKLGKSAILIIIINAVVPIIFNYGKAKAQEKYCDKALKLLEQMPKEKNSITKKWENYGLPGFNAYDSQAQIQLYNEYCRPKKCLHCNIGHHFLSLRQ